MRRFIPLALLLAAACGKSEPSTGSVGKPPPKGPPPAFDTGDAERTLRWLAERREAIEGAPAQGDAGNKAAAKKKLADEFAVTKGKTVDWRIKVKEVRAGGGVVPAHIELLEPGTPRRRLVIVVASPKGKSDTSPLPTSPPKAGWVAKLKAGDELVLKGVIESVQVASWATPDELRAGAETIDIPFDVNFREAHLTMPWHLD